MLTVQIPAPSSTKAPWPGAKRPRGSSPPCLGLPTWCHRPAAPLNLGVKQVKDACTKERPSQHGGNSHAGRDPRSCSPALFGERQREHRGTGRAPSHHGGAALCQPQERRCRNSRAGAVQLPPSEGIKRAWAGRGAGVPPHCSPSCCVPSGICPAPLLPILQRPGRACLSCPALLVEAAPSSPTKPEELLRCQGIFSKPWEVSVALQRCDCSQRAKRNQSSPRDRDLQRDIGAQRTNVLAPRAPLPGQHPTAAVRPAPEATNFSPSTPSSPCPCVGKPRDDATLLAVPPALV